MIFLTSDTHFWHRNILKYCPRPWNTVEEMNEGLIQNWNSVVKPDDTVYHLGDFAFCGNNKLKAILGRLAGKICLIKGNHDSYKNLSKTGRFEWIRDYYELKVEDPELPRGYQGFVLCHFPFLTWNQKDNGSVNLHGHTHASLSVDYDEKRIDVGVDNPLWNYTPVSYAQIKEELKKYKEPKYDHHGRSREDPYANF